MLKIIKVTGKSLSPFFLSGDYVVTLFNPRRFRNLRPGDTLVVDHPTLGFLIKNVRENMPSSKSVTLEGIHPNSLTSREIGTISYHNIVGRVIFHIKRSR